MIKKLLVGVGAFLTLGLIVFGQDLWSYVRTAHRRVESTVKDAVPLEFEIDRARQMVDDLLPDIRRNMHLVAEQEVELEQLELAIARQEEELSKQRAEMVVLRNRLKEGAGPYRFAGRTYTAEEIKRDLARRYERYKALEATLDAKKQLRDARRRQLEESRRKLDAMIAARRQLEVQIEQLEARLKSLQAAQAASEVQFDHSRLARAKALVAELRKRLDVAERVLASEGKLSGEIPVEEDIRAEEVIEKIDAEFGTGEEKDEPVGI